ncbi:hypothetical protein U1Q18_000693 [Sarracenia purpurea var. burkii]
MASQGFLCLLLVLFAGLIGCLHANQFNVGGNEGWASNPSPDYNHWAAIRRFQVNDTLLFKYKKGSDSVLVVTKEDYEKCETEKSIKKLEDGDSVFKFDRSGPFFFISGNKTNCEKGQKLTVVVLAVRNKPHTAPPSPSPTAGPPEVSPEVSPSPAIAPASPSPTVSSALPPASLSPVSTAPTPSTSSTPFPSTLPPSPEGYRTPSGAPGSGNSREPPGSSAEAFAPSVVFMSSVTFALSVFLQG